MNQKDYKNAKQDHKEAEKPAEAKEESVSVSRQEYEAMKTKSDERDIFYDKYLRAHSEFENAKKRIEKEKLDFIKYANDSIILEFLPIIDNLEIAEKHIKEAKDFKAVQEGLDMIQLQIQKFLKDIGIEKVKTVGDKFDPHRHEAVETEDAHGQEDGTVVAELKPGYALNGRLLRPASVKIVKKKTQENQGG